MNFAQRSVIVTGGAAGIGLAIAGKFLSQGASVLVVDQSAESGARALKSLGAISPKVHFERVDVSDYAACVAAVAEAERRFGTVDTLVNNAGISPKHNGRGLGLEELSVEEWSRVVNVNLNGTFNFSKAVVAGMKRQRFGRIVSMSSVAAKAYLDVCAVHYSATKAAVIGLTRHLAGELGEFGITVNAIAPGRIDTDMVAMAGDAVNQSYIDRTPLGRLGRPEEVADLCLYFASRTDSSFITGQVVDVAGGWLMT